MPHSLRLTAAALGVAVFTGAASAGTIDAGLLADGYISQHDGVDTIYSDGPFLDMQDISEFGDFAIQTTLIEFGLDGLQAGDIAAAHLVVIYNGGGTNGMNLFGYTGTADGAIGLDDLAGGSLITNFDQSSVPNPPGAPMMFDVTAQVLDGLTNGDSAMGFRFSPVGNQSQLQFRSSEWGDDEFAPRLVLTLVPAPGAVALLGIGLIAPRRRRS